MISITIIPFTDISILDVISDPQKHQHPGKRDHSLPGVPRFWALKLLCSQVADNRENIVQTWLRCIYTQCCRLQLWLFMFCSSPQTHQAWSGEARVLGAGCACQPVMLWAYLAMQSGTDGRVGGWVLSAQRSSCGSAVPLLFATQARRAWPTCSTVTYQESIWCVQL